jgi:hypothetical protein
MIHVLNMHPHRNTLGFLQPNPSAVVPPPPHATRMDAFKAQLQTLKRFVTEESNGPSHLTRQCLISRHSIKRDREAHSLSSAS